MLLFVAGCAAPPVPVPEYNFIATCPGGTSVPEIAPIVTPAQLRTNRDALEDALRHDEHARVVCAHRLKRAADIIRALKRER